MLRFLVQGSASAPYKVTADGEGTGLKMFCTCPAGRKSGRPCKHIQQVLKGSAANLVAPSDDLGLLRERAEGSSYVEWASSYVSPSEKARLPGCETVEDVLAVHGPALEQDGWVVELVTEDGEFPACYLMLYARFKTSGRVRKTPSVQLGWELLIWDSVVTEDGGSVRANVRPRVRPFIVRGNGDTATYADMSKALYDFLRRAGRTV